MKFASLEEARAARGVRLVVAGGVPSPWSEAAKGIFTVKAIDGLLVRFTANDEPLKQWTGWHNVPVLMIDDEPPRIHWTEILEAAERLGGARSVCPADEDARARMFGLAHELLGENGLVWCARLSVIHRGLITEGKEGFPFSVAQRLALKYGYAADRVPAARARVQAIVQRFSKLAEADAYLLGGALTALDIYLATAIAVLVPMSPELCPNQYPRVRHAFETGDRELSASVPRAVIEHRDRIYQRHLGLPVEV